MDPVLGWTGDRGVHSREGHEIKEYGVLYQEVELGDGACG